MVLFNKLIPIYSSASWNYSLCFKSLLQIETKINFIGSQCVQMQSWAATNKNNIPISSPISKYKKSCSSFQYPLATYHSRLFCNKTSSSPEKIQKALEDKEFQDILKDFAKDFGINQQTDDSIQNIYNDTLEDDDSISDTNVSSRTKETLSVYEKIHKERFKEFEDQDSQIIYSHEEELHLPDEFFHIDQEYDKKTVPHEVKRGIYGVYDIEELIPVLRAEKCFDISVMKIPRHYHYADYMVLATARSLRHLKAVTEFILKFYKLKKSKKDPFVIIEGEKLGNWKVIDMGNIVLHVFLEDIRANYDLESLWLLDQKYDTGGNVEADEVSQVLEEELEFLNCLKSDVNLEPEKEVT